MRPGVSTPCGLRSRSLTPVLLELLLVLDERGVPFNFNECAGLAEQSWTGSIGETKLGS